jgi:di/tricarboxylate transporter
MLLLGGIILTAVTGTLTPVLSIPIAAAAVLLLGCIKVTDTYKSVDWPAVATVGGMISFGFALEKTGAAAALAHETTMLVMGPGRYRFKHYLSMGSGMAIVAWLIASYVTPLIWRF